jgi:hypothetical protein
MYFERGALLFIPYKSEPDTDRESDATTYTGVHCLEVLFKRGIHMSTLSTKLGDHITMLAYIYSIYVFLPKYVLVSQKNLFFTQNMYC